MRYQLKNEQLSIEIDSLGAELKSVKNTNGQEYMWYGDPAYWGRTSPVLFPFVGSLKNKSYEYQGKTYPMGQHGFARDLEFTLEEQTEDTLWMFLDSTEETKENYPFCFRLSIGYKLKQNHVHVLWKVENTDTKTMYFSIGAHPAFLCPKEGETSKEGYGLQFAGLKELHHYGNRLDNGLEIRKDQVLPLAKETAVFTPGFFDTCTYIAEGKQTGEVSLLDPKGQAYVTVSFDTPLFAIWSPEGKNAPFVCIEPWYGRCDAEGFSGSLKERDYTNTLEEGKTFEASYQIAFS